MNVCEEEACVHVSSSSEAVRRTDVRREANPWTEASGEAGTQLSAETFSCYNQNCVNSQSAFN